MGQHLRAGFGGDLSSQPKVIDMRVRDDDAANVPECETVCAQFLAEGLQRRRVLRPRIDQRQLIAFGKIAVDRTDWKRRGNREGMQIIENRRPREEN